MKRDRAPDYAFEHFNIRIMQSDLRFSQDARATRLDVEQPVKLADGSTTCLKTLANGKPLMLVTGSLSCPMTLSSLPLLKTLIKRYADDFAAALIYVREAHPGDNYSQSHNHQDKQHKAREFSQLYQLDLPVIVDSVDGDLHQRLDTKPNSLHIIDPNGEVLFQALWAGDIDAIDTAAEQIAKGKRPGKKMSQHMFVPFIRGAGYMHETLNLAGKRAYHELRRGAPPVWLLSRTAGLFSFMPQRFRGVAAMIAWLVLILIIVFAVWG